MAKFRDTCQGDSGPPAAPPMGWVVTDTQFAVHVVVELGLLLAGMRPVKAAWRPGARMPARMEPIGQRVSAVCAL